MGSSGNKIIQKLSCELLKEEIFFDRELGSENLTEDFISCSYFDGHIINSSIRTCRVPDPKLVGGFFWEISHLSLK